MNIRAACVFVVCVFAALRAQAQGPAGPAGPPPNYKQLVAQIADLQARVAKLEGNITAADLVGTYTLSAIDTSMSGFVAGVPPHNATIQTLAVTGTVALNADGSASAASFTCVGSQLTQGAWTLTPVSCGDFLTVSSWTYPDGVVTLNGGDGPGFQLTVALGGRLLITALAPFHAVDPSSDSVVSILTRLQ